MIIGEIPPTSGTVLIDGHNITSDLSKTYQITGYSPQFDPFPVDVTGAEVLYLLARIKGYSRPESQEKTKQMLAALGISQYADFTVKYVMKVNLVD